MAHLLSLPADVLLIISNLVRPDGFESFQLSCRHIFSLGQNLRAEHEFCRRWVQNRRMVFCPTQYFADLLDVPKIARRWIPRYQLHLNISDAHYECGTGCLRKVALSQRDLLEYQILTRGLTASTRQSLGLRRPPTAMYDTSGNEMPSLDLNELQRPVVTHQRYLLVRFLENLQSLSIGDRAVLDYVLPRYRPYPETQVLDLPNLQTLTIHTEAKLKVQDIARQKSGRKLRSLVVYGPSAREIGWERESRTSLKFEDGPELPFMPVERLVLISKEGDASHLKALIDRMPNLRTFVWIDQMNWFDLVDQSISRYWDQMDDQYGQAEGLGQYLEDEISWAAYEPPLLVWPANRQDPVLNGSVDPSLHRLYDAEGVKLQGTIRFSWLECMRRWGCDPTCEELAIDCAAPPPWTAGEYGIECTEDSAISRWCDEFPFHKWRSGAATWNAKAFVDLLVAFYGATLDHLVLAVDLYLRPAIRQEHRIADFHGFTGLKKLEIDTCILRSDANGLPAIVDIVPSSLETLRLTIQAASYSRLRPLFTKPVQRKDYPAMREIVLRYAERGRPCESSTRLQPVSIQLQKEGIALRLRDIPLVDFLDLPISLDEEDDLETVNPGEFWKDEATVET